MNKKPDFKTRISNPKRLEEFRIDEILSIMSLSESETGADVGCGTGLFSLPIAKKLPEGKLFSIDIDREFVAVLDDKIVCDGISNVETIITDGYDTPIKESSLDFAFVCVVLHEIPDKEQFLDTYKEKLKTGGKIFIVEFLSSKRSLDDNGIITRTFIKPDETHEYLAQSGFENIQSKNLNELVYIMWAQNSI